MLAAVSIVAIVIGVAVVAVATNPPSQAGSGDAVLSSGAPLRGATGTSAGDQSITPVASLLGIITPTVRRPPDLADGRAFGRRDAPATLTVWGDFQCPFCGKFTREVEPRLIADYVASGKLRIVYRDWVFIGVESVAAAVAARCAGEQGQFWPYHDLLLWNQKGENQGGFSDERLESVAAAAGLDLPAFHVCTLEASKIAEVRAETEAGDEAKIDMTPTLVVDDNAMPGAPISDADYARLRDVIDASIAAHTSDHHEASPGQS